ncbi:DeoR/GlpR family DNA-binding transcription regulator [Acidithrix sp. C25]|uniref:DeoR/GlpR family DNA-binding transcription regulator n=1 Tax=Acidithrix sp. C25 TaxID=1671482 RepID=UPI00191BA247|nr:DeoR/GlpR family DNA-binding transcription regulator [Acidithrix sp. C25]CAG4908466.1 unnamed protein product [Acidithrix sp. C25]
MYPEERHEWIREQIKTNKRVEVLELANDLAVTPETIRKDLDLLETTGILKRVHGGAIVVERLRFEPNLDSRDLTARVQKEAIAKRALEEIPDGGSIIIDAGTTTARLASIMPQDRELMIVTNSISIGMILSPLPNLTILLIGGRLRSKTAATVDSWALSALSEIRVSTALIGTNGISIERGFTTADPTEAAVKRAMVAAAKRVIVLADHTKYGDEKFARFASISEVDLLITDNGIDEVDRAAMELAGLNVVVAPS